MSADFARAEPASMSCHPQRHPEVLSRAQEHFSAKTANSRIFRTHLYLLNLHKLCLGKYLFSVRRPAPSTGTTVANNLMVL